MTTVKFQHIRAAALKRERREPALRRRRRKCGARQDAFTTTVMTHERMYTCKAYSIVYKSRRFALHLVQLLLHLLLHAVEGIERRQLFLPHQLQLAQDKGLCDRRLVRVERYRLQPGLQTSQDGCSGDVKEYCGTVASSRTRKLIAASWQARRGATRRRKLSRWRNLPQGTLCRKRRIAGTQGRSLALAHVFCCAALAMGTCGSGTVDLIVLVASLHQLHSSQQDVWRASHLDSTSQLLGMLKKLLSANRMRLRTYALCLPIACCFLSRKSDTNRARRRRGLAVLEQRRTRYQLAATIFVFAKTISFLTALCFCSPLRLTRGET